MLKILSNGQLYLSAHTHTKHKNNISKKCKMKCFITHGNFNTPSKYDIT